MMKPRPFQQLDKYKSPALPTEETVRRLLTRVRDTFSSIDDAPFVADDRLRAARGDALDTLAQPPSCGPFLRELDMALRDDEDEGPRWRRLVVLPPCDAGDLMAKWAERSGHRIVDPPLRSNLLTESEPKGSPIDDLDAEGDDILVFPRLEDWFLRHRDGLGHLVRLLDWLAAAERPFVIGCGAWAWAYVRAAAEAHMALPSPIAGQAFDALSLHAWFHELAEEDGTLDHVFRLTTTGEDVFALDEEGALENDYLVTLAARSHGVPWVAWNLWRRSLRYGLDDEGEDVEGEQQGRIKGEDTLWVAQATDAAMPDAMDRTQLLILHALLIHGSLDINELYEVLPLERRPTVLSALVRAGLIRREGGRYACLASGYPVIRDRLEAAGFPMGAL